MAECMEEFDEATPLKESYCSRLTPHEYEEQADSCTEQALRELMEQLDTQPELYRSVLRKRRREQKEEEGFMSYLKVKFWSMVGSEDAACSVSDLECQEEAYKLKSNIMKAHSYSQESKGRRYSQRLAEKRRSVSSTPARGGKMRAKNVPPPPPPPPIPVSTATTSIPVPFKRRPLRERNTAIHQRQSKCPARGGSLDCVLGQLKSSECRRRLRPTVAKSPGGTPLDGWGARKLATPDGVRQFNQLLIDKFRNVKTPPSPYRSQLASPGTFDSPL